MIPLTVDRLVLSCSSSVAERLAERHTAYVVPGLQTLFYAGHRPVGFYLLLGGQARVLIGSESRVVPGPAILGLEHLMENEPYPASVEALPGARLAYVPRTGSPRPGSMSAHP